MSTGSNLWTMGQRPTVVGSACGMSISCSVNPIVRWRGQWMAA